MKKFFNKELIIYYILSLYFLFGLSIYKDFGVGIEEHFQRSSGFYWLEYILQFTEYDLLKNQVRLKISEIKNLYPGLPPVEIARHYGVIFDLPMAIIETSLNINDPIDQFYLRHLFNFIIFFISGYFFYLIIRRRIKIFPVTIISTLFYLLSPRIFGNSFFDGKDLLFLSLTTITFYFYLKYSDDKKKSSLILFSFLCSISVSTRIMGLFFPISFFAISIFQILNSYKIKYILKDLIIFLFLFFLFLFIHWPYLWTLEIVELLDFFKNFKVASNPDVFFNGNYYNSEYLPFTYIPLWITISIPEIVFFTFLIGILFYTLRLFNRITNIQEKSITNDLWRGTNEKIDLFYFLSFLQIIIVYTSFDLSLYSSWRHFLFLNFFITYFSSIGVFYLLIKIKKNTKIEKFFFIFLIFCIFEIIFNLYKYHPYQSMYFNNLVTKEMKKKFEVDTQSLSRVAAIKEIIIDANNKEKISIGTASWTPLENAISLIKKEDRERINFIGTSNKQNADYIYSNHYYEINPKYVKKYQIPGNFELLKSFSIDNTLIYSIYKKTQ